MSETRIADVRVVQDERPPRDPWPWRDGLPRVRTTNVPGWIEIESSGGVVGRAATDDAVFADRWCRDYLRPDLVGRDAFDREEIWQRTWEINRLAYVPTTMLGIVDVALWDLAGIALDQPVHRLLGSARRSLPAYASTVTFESTEEYLDVIDQCRQLGYRAVKLHAWGDARRDAALAVAVREHVGDEIDLMFDGSAGYDLADAIFVGHALAGAGYRWYEEPMREFSIGSYRRLADRVQIPLLVAEITEGAHYTAADFVASGSASYLRTSTGFKAGITGAMRIAHLADAVQMRAEVHGAGRPNEHLCMAISNTSYYESLVTTNPVVPDPRLDATATLPAPQQAGIGWD